MLYGTGKYNYGLIDGWAKLPQGWSFDSVPGLFVDAQDTHMWNSMIFIGKG